MKRRLESLFLALVLATAFPPATAAKPDHAGGKPASLNDGCQPRGTPRDDEILCTGIENDEVEAGRGDDLVVVEDGATVATVGSDPRPRSTAIDGQSGNDTIVNHGLIDVNVLSTGQSLKGIPGLGADRDPAADRAADDRRTATAVGIAGGEGADSLDNAGVMTVRAATTMADAGGPGAGGGVGPGPRASSALSAATGIDGGDDDDVIVNRGSLTVTATSVVAKPDVSGNGTRPVGPVTGGVTAEATAVGIRGGDGDDRITNTGDIVAIATASMVELDAAGTGNAANPGPRTDSSTEVEAIATGIEGGAGADTIRNEQTIAATATATLPSVSIDLAARGGLDIDAVTTASSRSTGIDAGAGDDEVRNSGTVDAEAGATAFSVSGSASTQGNSPVLDLGSNASIRAEALASGIDGGSGDDWIVNDGSIVATALAEALSARGALSVDGQSTVAAASESSSRATGIDGGTGDDTVDNAGSILATATSLSQGLAIGVTVAGSGDGPALPPGLAPKRESAVAAGAKSESIATGIAGDGAEREETSSIRFTGSRIALVSNSRAATGDNTISNQGSIAAVATSQSVTGSGALGIDGGASANATSEARSTATGIEAGGGHDLVDNSGLVTAVSTATATGLSVGVSIASDSSGEGSKAAADTGVTAAAATTGIAGDGEEGSVSTEIGLAVLPGGLAIDYRSSREGASGNDILRNTGSVDVIANAASGAGAGTVTVEGDASARATSTASGSATGIDAGDADDIVDNSGSILAEAGAVATGLSVGVSLQSGGDGGVGAQSVFSPFDGSKAAVDAAVTAETHATGIAGDAYAQDSESELRLATTTDGLTFDSRFRSEAASGRDEITNTGAVDVLSNALSGAGSAEIALDSDAAVNAASTASSTAIGIDAGADDDRVINTGDLLAEAGSVAAAMSVGVGVVSGQDGDTGTAKASKAAADAGVTAGAAAIGIRGDSGEGLLETETHLGIEIDPDENTGGIDFMHARRAFAATGDDEIDNNGAIAVLANALSEAGGGAVSLEGDASASATSTAGGMATGINAGGGDDRVTNTGTVFAEAGAVATALSVGVGVAGSGDDASSASATVNANVESNATAAGILGDGDRAHTSTEVGLAIDQDGLDIRYATHEEAAAGDDHISNDGGVDVVAGAASGAGTAAVAVEGEASVTSTSGARSAATGIGGGGGTDSIGNRGTVTATATSAAAALNAAISTKGAARATGGIWQGGTDSRATATGIAGDGGELDRSTEYRLGADFDDLAADFRFTRQEASVAGDDTIENDGSVTTTAVAESLAVDVAVAASQGMATAITNASAQARATGIDAGGGDDEVTNRGELVTTAVANANAISVSVSGKGNALAGNAIWRGGASADAVATGIDGDVEGSGRTTTIMASVDTEGVEAEFGHEELAATGDDVIDNEGKVTATSVAVTPAIAVAVGVKGMAGAISTSEATSRAAAIDAGNGNDSIYNRGELRAAARSVATAINVAVSPRSGAVAADAIWDGGTTADATAVGIDADGTSADARIDTRMRVDADDSAAITHASRFEVAGGRDTITNLDRIEANAVAEAPAISVAVAIKGAAIAASTATASATASAIDAGDGADTITNDGELIATAVANANAVNVAVTAGSGVGLAGNPVWNGGTVSEAVARGIDADGGGTNHASDTSLALVDGAPTASHRGSTTGANGRDLIVNTSTVEAGATSVSVGLAVGVAVTGVSGAIATTTANSMASAIDAGAGDDEIRNSGELKARASSVATSVNVAVTGGTGVAIAADAVFDGGTTANARARGIDADGDALDFTTETTLAATADGAALAHERNVSLADGRDVIVNEATIGATATAVAPSVSVGIAVTGASVAASTATATSEASAIHAGAGDDEITNRGVLEVNSVANADAVNVSVAATGAAVAGNNVWNGGAVSRAVARGIEADGTSAGSSQSTVLGYANDRATFLHRLSSDAARGEDLIDNQARIDVDAVAVTAGVAVGVTTAGAAGAISTSTANSHASAIDAGDGGDEIHNRGELTATATSTAVALNVGVAAGTGLAVAADAVWDGGTTAQATARGIDADGTAVSSAEETSIAVDATGARIAHDRSKSSASGNDTIMNDAAIGATATAVAPSVSVAVAVTGVGVSASTATARSQASAINAGAGSDDIINHGALDVVSVANADAVNVSVTPAGVAVAGNNIWNGGTVAEAVARGIDADGDSLDHSQSTELGFSADGATFSHRTSVEAARGDDFIDNDARIDVDAVAVTAGVAVGVTAAGAAGAISTSTANSHASAIDAGDGDDGIHNRGELTATAHSTAVALNVGVAAGTGLAVAADAVWDGGTTAQATARGIDADGTAVSRAEETSIAVDDAGARIAHDRSWSSASGDDTITNDEAIFSTATAVAPSVSVAVAVTGVGVAASTATAQSQASAIDAGAGNDNITNHGALNVVSVANADAVNVSITGAGGALAGNNVFDGGVTAEARATGIDADGSGDSSSIATGLTFSGGTAGFSHRNEYLAASGNDTIFNDAVIDADATAVSAGVAVTVPVAGVGLSASTATARAATRAIDAGSGDDTIITDAAGDLNATATSVAAAVNVSVTPAGLAAATDALWNGGTTAETTVKGIDADGSRTNSSNETTLSIDAGGATFRHLAVQEPGSGNDTIVNDAEVDVNSTAVSSSVGVSVAVAGVAAAASTATTRADAAGIDAGGGDDDITNRGELDVDAVSNANAVAVSVTPAGVAVTGDAVWDGGTTAEASATGLTADGSASGSTTETIVSRENISHRSVTESAFGDDTILNEARIDAQAVSVAAALDVPVAVAGLAAAVSTSTARADASAIDASGGDDRIINRGELAATAVGNADTANVSVSVTGVALAGNAVWDGGTTVEASAMGIDADGRGSRVTKERTIERDGDAITVAARETYSSASGDDMIVNEAGITARATAVPVSVAVGVAAVGGVGAAVSTSTATSRATAIDAGGGDDIVINDGALEASANSTAVTVNGSFSLIGAGISGDALWDGGTTAEATAFGIDGDGRGATVTHERSATVGPAGADTDSDTTTVASTGDDDIHNTGSILAHAKARSPSVAVGLGGILGAAFATSTATSKASAIDGGSGDDDIDNAGVLTAIAESTAVAVNVSVGAVALSVNDVWDGGTTATATATGIAGGAGNDTVTNDAAVSALADANAPSVSIALGAVLGAAVTTSTAESAATAIDGGDGADVIHNTGDLNAFADSNAVTVNVSSGLAALSVNDVWDGGTTATATARGIDGGDGVNTITNAARIESSATSNSTSPAVSVGLGVGVGAAISTSTARSDAAAIAADAEDDSIDNDGVLVADSRADADTVNVALSPLGGAAASDATWEGGTTAEAASTGVDADGGNDSLTNRGSVTAMSGATTGSTSVATVGTGVSAALAASTSTARSTAMDGGEGDDTIANHGSLAAEGMADARGTSVAVGLIGAATADSSSNATAASTGIDAGAGDDTLANTGPLVATAEATARASAVEVAVLGATVGNPLLDSGTEADATAIGLSGGAGADGIANESTIDLVSTARTDATTVSVSLLDFGGGSADVSASAAARATGIAGGTGTDVLENAGAITATVTAESPVRDVDVSLGGDASADFSSDANADARGIDGGADDDEITNTGLVDVAATARAPAAGTSVKIVGVTAQEASATATATAAGLDGGAGDDTIINTGSMLATVRSEATVLGSTWTLAGSSTQQGIANAIAGVTGIGGGTGRDVITNVGLVEAGATAMLETQGTSTVGVGGAMADASVNGAVSAIGIDGGDADDTIHNTGEIQAAAHSNSSATGAAFSLLGAAVGRTGTTSAARTIGIAGGLGNDIIDNNGILSARTTTAATASNSAWTFAGGATGAATLRAAGDTTGIAGGAGSDAIRNFGVLGAHTTATLSVSGGASTIFGGAGSGSSVSADVQAIGISGGGDDDWIENRGSMTVAGTAAMASATAAFSLNGNPSAGAFLAATSNASGIAGGDGEDWIYNLGDVAVTAASSQLATGGSRSQRAGSGTSSTASRAIATATGLDGGAGPDHVVNDGTVIVDANPTGTGRNTAEGGFVFGTAGAVSSLVLSSTGRGVLLEDGDNELSNAGSISVNAGGNGLVDAQSDGGRLVNGSAYATALISGGGTAWGVKADGGDDVVFNDGSLSVLVDPLLVADQASANGNGITNANGTAFARADTTGTGLGIELGDGDNRFTNNGTLNVTATPGAEATAFADSDLAAVASATAEATATARAIGVRTGSGDDRIVNHGTINVLADPAADATAQATADVVSISKTICGPLGFVCKTITVTIGTGEASATAESVENATAIGIATGSGDDEIASHGTITATEIINGGASNGTAIAAGAGNDTLLLGDGSLTRGDIDLGAGDDTFHLAGTPGVDGNIDSGAGTNSLVFDGAGAFANPLPGFHNARKIGGGTYALPGLGSMDRLEVEEGTLRLASDYAMGTDSMFGSIVEGDGSHGRLDVQGIAALDGDLVVDRGAGAYTDGTTYDVITADSVSGAFDNESLPEPTALVSFTGTQLADAYRVEASVEPFTTTASNGVGNAVAGALDAALTNAAGDMSNVLGAVQQADMSEFDALYTGISAESHDQFRSSTFDAMQRYGRAMHARMNQVRARYRGANTSATIDRTRMAGDALLAHNGPVPGVMDLRDDGTAPGDADRRGMWVSAFGQASGRSGSAGYTAYDYRTMGQVPLGIDVRLGDNLVVGFAAGRSYTEVARERAFGEGEGTYATVYGTWFSRNSHVEAVVSRSTNEYANARRIDLGDEQRVAVSEHGGRGLSADLEARHTFGLDTLDLEPFGALHYDRLDEEAFTESGAGSLDLMVQRRRTESVTSELGVRAVRLFELPGGELIPEMTIVWKRDFDADGHPVTAAFSGAPDATFTVDGQQTDRDSLVLGGALSYAADGGLSAFAGLNAEIGERHEETSGLLQFEYRW